MHSLFSIYYGHVFCRCSTSWNLFVVAVAPRHSATAVTCSDTWHLKQTIDHMPAPYATKPLPGKTFSNGTYQNMEFSKEVL